MIVTLRGKLERTTKPGDANAVPLWRWSGSWAFGRAVEIPSTKSGSSGATSSKQNPLPFLYTFERPEDPSRVAVPSLQKPVDPLLVAEEDTQLNQPAFTGQELQDNQVKSEKEENAETEKLPGEENKVSVSTESPPQTESKADESAETSDEVNPSASMSSTAANNGVSTKAKFISFADKLIPDWPDFTDAITNYKGTMVPPSGLWKGYFETAVGGPKKDKQHPATTIQIQEECVLFLNSTPPKSARVSFEDTAANLLLAPGHIHVRGRGENQYGVFELLGSLNAASGDLVIQRKYIVHPTPSSGPGRPRIRRTRDSQQASIESSDGARPYFTRKRPMSWKKRAAMEDEQESASPDASAGGKGMKRGRSANVGPGCDVGKRARLDSETSHSIGGIALSPGMTTSTFGALPRLTVTIPGSIGPASNAAATMAPPGSVSALLPTVPTSATPAGSGVVGASGNPVLAYQGNKQPQTTALLAAAAASLASKPGGKNASKSTSTSVRSNAAAAAAAALSSSSTASSASSHLKLPPVGDPHKARWRAAHFLYYHRNDGEDGGGSAPAKSPTSAGASVNSAANNKDAGSTGPKYVIYEGEMMNSHREGRGICLYSNGLLYEGQWRRDKEQGTGKLMTSDRKFVIYEGEWERGRMHGRGVYYYGEFWNRSSKSTKDGKSDNPSPAASSSVPRYDGEFKENLRHGTGTYFLKDGSVFVGNWQNNVMSGRGVFTWPDGSVYDGDWKDGKRHGQGVLRASDGFTYDGNWSQNSMDGRGSATYPNGQQYIGLFTAGRRDGRGTMLFTNGATYEGRFRDDAVDGQGTLRLSRSLVVPRSEDEDDDEENAEEGKPDKDAGEDKEDDEKPDFMIPISFQSDIGNIHRKAGFTLGGE